MSRDPFSTPGTGAKITDFEGSLLLVTPTEYLEGVQTAYGEKDAVEADVVVLDAEGGPEEVDGLRIFQGKLIGQTKRNIGKSPVLGRLGKEPAKQKGHQAGWSLLAPTDEDKRVAREYLASLVANDPFAAAS